MQMTKRILYTRTSRIANICHARAIWKALAIKRGKQRQTFRIKNCVTSGSGPSADSILQGKKAY